jgi:hypothetical protein
MGSTDYQVLVTFTKGAVGGPLHRKWNPGSPHLIFSLVYSTTYDSHSESPTHYL